MAEPESSTEKAADGPISGASQARESGTTGSVLDTARGFGTARGLDVIATGSADAAEARLLANPTASVDSTNLRAHSASESSIHGTRATTAGDIVAADDVADLPAAQALDAYELLARSARLGDLVALASRIVTDAARSRTPDWAFSSKVAALADDAKLRREDADTRFGNVLDVLATGGEGSAERALAAALWAHAVAESPRTRTEDEDRLAGDILWLATHSAFDATPLLDRALGEDAGDIWAAIADRIRRIEQGKGGALGRGEAVVGCAALAASGADKAKALSAGLLREVKDPVLLRVLATSERASSDIVRIDGELIAPPRGPIVTAFLAFSGILFAVHAARIVARLALAYRRPAEVSLSESGVRVKTRTEMLGRTLREREDVIPRSGLVRVVREVRFPRAAFYAGLLALALGSYIGVRAFVDGVRAASPSLLLVGLGIVAVGIGADFVLGTLLPGARGRCRVAFVPRKGRTLCVADVDARRVDDALSRSLARR